MKSFITAISGHFRCWFHKRNIIIVSERKVKHIPISGGMQFFTVVLVMFGICWASYSTGSFMAARSALKERTQALRSVTNARIETTLNPLAQMAPVMAEDSDDDDALTATLSDPMFTLSALNHNKLFDRIATLENQVTTLKNTNEAIIERVRDTASDHIDSLESIIRHTGLNPETLKKQLNDNKSSKNAEVPKAEGGPYIPDDMIDLPPQADAMFSNLEELEALRQIVSNMPLGLPIHHATEESPFGHRIDPINGRLAFHSGLDLAGPAGSKVYSTADGKVVSAGIDGGYGNAIDIDHGFGLTTRYGHLSQILVKPGQLVHKGQAIGVQGSTGRSTGPHLHYEVRYHAQAMNPKNFIDAGIDVSEK